MRGEAAGEQSTVGRGDKSTSDIMRPTHRHGEAQAPAPPQVPEDAGTGFPL